MAPAPTTRITAECACKSFQLTLDLQTSTLPISAALCLCNSCRRLSGTCGTSYAGTVQVDDPAVLNLTIYKASNGGEHGFCSTCGAHALKAAGDGSWQLATGLWDRTEDVIGWDGCRSVEETLDGGVSVWLGDAKDRAVATRPDLRGEVDTSTRVGLPSEHPTEERLKATCDCGGVIFYITRPNAASREASSPFSDLIVPFHTGVSSANPGNETWWLRDGDTKYLTGFCMCNSCRLASGFAIQTWAFVPKCNIFREDGGPLDYGIGTMKTYPSSEDVWREFCGVCGATIFWHCKWRPDLVDISAGLFNPEQGARVETWLAWWTGRVSFAELAVDKRHAQSLGDGLERGGGT